MPIVSKPRRGSESKTPGKAEAEETNQGDEKIEKSSRAGRSLTS